MVVHRSHVTFCLSNICWYFCCRFHRFWQLHPCWHKKTKFDAKKKNSSSNLMSPTTQGKFSISRIRSFKIRFWIFRFFSRFDLTIAAIVTAILHATTLGGVFGESLPILLPSGCLLFASAVRLLPSVQLIYGGVSMLLLESILAICFALVMMSDYIRAVHYVLPRKCSCESEATTGQPLQWSAM